MRQNVRPYSTVAIRQDTSDATKKKKKNIKKQNPTNYTTAFKVVLLIDGCNPLTKGDLGKIK